MFKICTGIAILSACFFLILHQLISSPKNAKKESKFPSESDHGSSSHPSKSTSRIEQLPKQGTISFQKNKALLNPSSQEAIATINRLWQEQNYQEVSSHFEKWLKRNPDAAISFVANLQHPYEPMHFTPELFVFFNTLSRDEALSSSKVLQKKPEVAVSVIADVYANFVEQEQTAALDWLLQQDSEFAQKLGYRVALGGALENDSESLAQILEFEKGPIRENLVTGLVESWLLNEPDEITEHLNNSSWDPIYDRAIMNYLDNAAIVNPADALSWAESIAEENLRQEAIKKVTLIWQESNPATFSR